MDSLSRKDIGRMLVAFAACIILASLGLTAAIHERAAETTTPPPTCDATTSPKAADGGDLTEVFPAPQWQPDAEKTKIYYELNKMATAARLYEEVFSFQKAAQRWGEIETRAKRELPAADWLQADARVNSVRMGRAMAFSEKERSDLQQARTRLQDGRSLLQQGKGEEAVRAFDEAIQLVEDVWGEDDRAVLDITYEIATMGGDNGGFHAKDYAYRLLQLQRRILGETHPYLMSTLMYLCQFELWEGQAANAASLARNAYLAEYRRASAACDSPVYILDILSVYANIMVMQNKLAYASSVIEYGKDISKRFPRSLLAVNRILLTSQLALADADGNWRHSWDLLQKGHEFLHAADPTDQADAWCIPAGKSAYLQGERALFIHLGEYYLAERAATSFLEMPTNNEFGEVLWQVRALYQLAYMQLLNGKTDSAEQTIQRADELRAQLPLVPRMIADDIRVVRGAYEREKGNLAESIRLLQEAVESQRQVAEIDVVVYTRCLVQLALSQLANKSPAEAERLLLECQAIRDKKLREGHPDRGEVLYELAAAYMAQKKYDQAEKALAQAEAIYRKAVGERWPVYRNVLRRQVELYRAMNRLSDAAKLDERVKALDAKYPPLQNLDDLPPSAFTGEPEETAPKPAAG